MCIYHPWTHKLTAKQPNHNSTPIRLVPQNPQGIIAGGGQGGQMGYFPGFARDYGEVIATDTEGAWRGGINKSSDDDYVRGWTLGKGGHNCRR